MFDGQRRRQFAVRDQRRKARRRRFGEAQQAIRDAVLELVVVAPAIAADAAAPGGEGRGFHHRDDLGGVKPIVAGLGRRKRQIGVAGLAREDLRGVRLDVVVLEVGVDPVVFAVDAEGGDRRLQPQIEIDGGEAAVERLDECAQLRCFRADFAVRRQEALKGERRADVGDDDRRPVNRLDRFCAAPVDRFHPDRGAAAHDDFGHFLADPDRAAARLDALFERAGDASGAAGGKPAAPEIAADDEGVNGEGALLRRHAVVAPLRRQSAFSCGERN